MKTQAIYLHETRLTEGKPASTSKGHSRSFRELLLPVLTALFPAVLVSVICIWAISIGAIALVSATFWGLGFIFLALALDADDGMAGMRAISGLSLMALAWLSSYVAPEFGVLAGFLVSAWISIEVIRRFGPGRTGFNQSEAAAAGSD